MNRVALWILIPIFMFVGVFAASETVRVKTLNLLIREFDVGTEFRMQEQTSDNAAMMTERPSAEQVENAVPDDFSLDFSDSNAFLDRYIFRNNNGAEIRVTLRSLDGSNGSLSIDTEDAEVWYESIGLYDVMLVQKDNSYQAIWSSSVAQMMYIVYGSDIPLETILNISSELIRADKTGIGE